MQKFWRTLSIVSVLTPFGFAVLYGLAILFALIGSLVVVDSMLPVTILVFTIILWASIRIIREAVESVKYLSVFIKTTFGEDP